MSNLPISSFSILIVSCVTAFGVFEEITDTILERCGVLTTAYDLDGTTLSRDYEGLWKTKHPRWDLTLFSYLYNEDNRALLERRKQALTESLHAIFSIKDEEITYTIIWMLYYIARNNFIPINIVESVFQQSLSQTHTFLSNEKQSWLYAPYIATAYHELKKYQEALDISNEALRLNSHNDMAYNSKGLALTELERYDEAIECLDRALEINPFFASAWVHKGNALDLRKP